MNISERGIPLVYQDDKKTTQTKHILTVECHIEWKNIYVVPAAWFVVPLDYFFRRKFQEEHLKDAWSDDIPEPVFCEWLVKRFVDFEWHQPSLDMIYGRYHRRFCNDSRSNRKRS